MSPIRGSLEDVGITNGDTGFSLGYFGPTLVLIKHDIRKSLKLIQVLADTELRSNQVLYQLLLNEYVETRSSLISISSDVICTCACR